MADVTETGLKQLRQGGKKALAEALASIEVSATTPETIELLDAACAGAVGHVIGITGPPGVGKSTLIATLIKAFRAADETVGVIAIDPSSRRSGGALLGDRVRIDTDPADTGVFIRSMAARDRLGGLAAITAAAVVLMRAVYDRVIVETVGVGQSETDITSVADSVLLCVQPGSGDSLQYMKAGIAEIPDIAVVTKADLGAVARQTKRDLQSALTTAGSTTGLIAAKAWQVPVLAVGAGDRDGITVLLEAIDDHKRHLEKGILAEKRSAQVEAWLIGAIREAYGSEGVKHVKALVDGSRQARCDQPFRRLASLLDALAKRLA